MHEPDESPRLRLLCDSNPMCYGSSSALLSILDHLDAHVTCLTWGITGEILEGDPAVDATLEVDVKDPEAVAQAVPFESFDAVLVVSNQSNIEVYAASELELFFVDILYFFGRRKDQPVWSLAEQTFAQVFPGVEERLARGASPGEPLMVGPLVRTPRATREGPGEGTLVNLGGGRSRWVIPGVNSPYPAMVIAWIEAMADALPRPITLAAGEDAARVARQARTVPEVEVGTYPQSEFLTRMQHSALYLTAPGLNAVFEGAMLARDMLVLPPQNATQIAQLEIYERVGLAPAGLNLAALDPDFDVEATALGEERLTEEVLASLARLHRDTSTTARVVEHLERQLHAREARHEATKSFLESLGGPGGPTVARVIHDHWRQTCE